MKTIRQRLDEKLKKMKPAQRSSGGFDALIAAIDEALAERDGIGTVPGVGTSPSKTDKK